MTEQKFKNPAKNRSLVITLMTIFIFAGAWLTYFLISFDLNDYRTHLESELSSMISLPVSIGALNFEVHGNNLALHVNGLHLGDRDSQLEINAPELSIELEWLGLLQQDLKFNAIDVSNPEIHIRTIAAIHNQAPDQATQTPILIDQALVYNGHIEDLAISDGLLRIRRQGAEDEIYVSKINGTFKNIRIGEMAQLSVEGEIVTSAKSSPSSWQLQGEATLMENQQQKLSPHFDLDIHSKSLALQTLRESFSVDMQGINLSGIADLDLHLEGVYPNNVNFQVGLSSSGLELLPAKHYSKPIMLKHLTASGKLLRDNDLTKITDLSLQVDNSKLSGQLEWTAKEPFRLAAAISNSKFEIKQLKQWLPDTGDLWESVDKNLLDSGSLHLQKTRLNYSKRDESGNPVQIEEMAGELQDIAWSLQNSPNIEIQALPFSIQTNQWEIKESPVQMGSLEITAHGKGQFGKNSFVFESLDFDGSVLPQEFMHEWYIPKKAMKTEGKIAIKGHLEGSHDKLAVDFQADLSHLSLHHPTGLKLDPDRDDKLAIHATITPQGVNLDHGSVKWSAAKGHINGSYVFGNPNSLKTDALLSINDLTRLAESLPLLDRLELRGQADLSISQRGAPEVNAPKMTLTLRNAGLKATRHIADLNSINGRINVQPTGLHAEGLSVQLGESLLNVDATLSDFENPHLSLDVNAPAVRAKDLVFYSDSAVLRDIDGHLEIDKQGLTFSPVDVRLDGGTDASVKGTIKFAPPYPVNLDISSDYALISEVIRLWKGASRNKTKSGSGEAAQQGQPVPIVINAQVDNGDLYGMKFSKASGIVKPSREQLVIHPLDFSIGEGYCNVQVITDFKPDQDARLRISGHAEDVDALEVYRELLNQKSIVKGKLRGDFYLTGDIGSNYLPSTYGRFNIQISDGVLHQFPILSKIFSLLNVSQIFAFKLPDMDLEGMPFTKLTGNLSLDGGILRSDDLAIQSEAMNQSYTGQLNLVNKEIDLSASIHPLGTVDKIVSKIPIAGWLLTGEDKALLTAHFRITGKTDSVSVQPKPLETLAEPTIGLLRRTLKLPFKLVEDPQILWGGQSKKDTEE